MEKDFGLGWRSSDEDTKLIGTRPGVGLLPKRKGSQSMGETIVEYTGLLCVL